MVDKRSIANEGRIRAGSARIQTFPNTLFPATMDSLADGKVDENERATDEGNAIDAGVSRQSEGSMYLLRAPRDEKTVRGKGLMQNF